MRSHRLLLAALPGLVIGGGTVSLAACGGNDPVEVVPRGAPEAPGVPGLATDYFEVPDDGAARLEADLDLALGRVETARAEAGYLFQAEVALPQERIRPRFTVSRTGDVARVALSLDEAALSPRGVRRGEAARWKLYLPTRTPLDLTLRLGAATADLDLTGVPVRRLRLDAGLSRATLRFVEANPVEMEDLEVKAGLAEFRAEGLGHARFRRMRFEGGAGRFALDFSGTALLQGAEATVEVGMADLRITLPAGRPIAVEAPDSPVVSVHLPRGFVRDGRVWRSPEAVGVAEPFRLRVSAGPGRVDVRLAE